METQDMMPPDNQRKKRFGLNRLVDKLAEWAIAVAGLAVIAAMFAMLVLIVRETAPLFLPASQKAAGRVTLPAGISPGEVVFLGVDADLRERARVAAVVLRDGRGGFAVGRDGKVGTASFSPLPGAPANAEVLSAARYGDGTFSLLWNNGTVSLYGLTMDFVPTAEGGVGVAHAFRPIAESRAELDAGRPAFAFLRGDRGNQRMVAVYPHGEVVEKRLAPGKGLLARGKARESVRSLRLERGGKIVTGALNPEGRLYLGTETGNLLSVDLSGEGALAPEVTPAFRDRRSLTGLAFLNGEYAIGVADALGGVSVWFPRREDGVFRLRRSVEWPGDGSRATDIAVSGRDRGFIVLDATGRIRWFYSTTGKELLDLPPAASRALALALNPRADTLATLHADGGISFHRLDSSYPEAGWTGFFRRLLYEGYEKAAFVWQSTGSDASEAKLSLVPLIWGSVKAAVFALLFATPIALAAAMYLSQFAAPAWRARLKPAVEMLAAVPSVVIGFIAALWLAPLLESHLQYFARHFQYDQRNALVIAIAMGFAVIPTVFSLAEDAITAVPPALSAASLALGASKWQTVTRVVLPTASPGIFTAVMLGFGRAVGETMIVLMAAGNTPIISLSPFNGMRTLSANIAVEMPEAPVGGTLYRTLFLCALILFVLTLVINSVAEVFRHRLRRRYGKI